MSEKPTKENSPPKLFNKIRKKKLLLAHEKIRGHHWQLILYKEKLL